MNQTLKILESYSLSLLRQADKRFEKIGVAWSSGKDSTLCVYLFKKIRKTFPVLFTDTYNHFPETYQFRDRLVKEWDLDLHVNKAPVSRIGQLSKMECCKYHKVDPPLKQIEELGLDAIIVGVRHDETGRSTKNTEFNQWETHWRVRPILNWKWKQVLEYHAVNQIPLHPLYAKDFTSVGCARCTNPNPEGLEERAGRDNAEAVAKAETIGYWRTEKKLVE